MRMDQSNCKRSFLGLLLALTLANSVHVLAFSTTRSTVKSAYHVLQEQKEQHLSALQMVNSNNNNNNFDLSKPTFDLFSLRSIRNDALLQYSSLNQSEPLRINIYLILTLTCFSFPTIKEAVGLGPSPYEASTISTLSTIGISALGGIASAFLFVKECQSRSRQLTRMEKELNAEFLTLKLPTKNKLDPDLYNSSRQPTQTLKSLRGKARVLAICGPMDELKKENVLLDLRVLRRRLGQANAVVVIVPTDGNGSSDLMNMGVKEEEIRSCQWLGQAQDQSAWLDYFQSLSNDGSSSDSSNQDPRKELVWFGLNYNGRSFASGKGKPRILEIMGQNLRPVELLDEDDEAETVVGAKEDVEAMMGQIASSRVQFYKALTSGDLEGMNSMFSTNEASEVTKVLEEGGRVDNWETCLAEGARPAEMQVSGSDVLIESPTLAYSTTIEFPAVSGGYGTISNACLLAVQRWTRSSKEEDWKLEHHQTIPWSSDSRAGGTLLGDRRGCVALTRGQDRRTFGGLIG